MVVGIRTVTAMAQMLPVRFPTHAVDNHAERRSAAAGMVAVVPIRRVVAAPDKFKGTLTAAEVAAAVGHACWELGVDCVEVPMADGGDGLLEALGGANRTSTVTGPLGDTVKAPWRLARGTAVIEMARASGLTLVGGAAGNDPLNATTTGTGELIDHALDAGARRIIVGLGGSATTDGGFGAIRAITAIARLKQVELLVACDVTTTFTDAAAVFGPQKGASRAQVAMLTRRLERLTQMFLDDFGVDVASIPGGGAAGGLGGALAALGGTLVPGFELVADELDLYDHLEGADLVITGEGCLDDSSSAGKVVGGVASIAAEMGIPVLAIVGSDERSDRSLPADIDVVSLVDDYGEDNAFAEPKRLVERATATWLSAAR
jgi:glycerate 2-kinase